jgi:hypothetical protein
MQVGAIEILRFARYARLARPPFDPDLLHPNQDEDAYKNFILDYRCVPAPWMARWQQQFRVQAHVVLGVVGFVRGSICNLGKRTKVKNEGAWRERG